MTKKELLTRIAQKEYEWLKSLDNAEFVNEFNGWFTEPEYQISIEDYTEDEFRVNRLTIWNDEYVDDYMRYREDESVEELQAILNK